MVMNRSCDRRSFSSQVKGTHKLHNYSWNYSWDRADVRRTIILGRRPGCDCHASRRQTAAATWPQLEQGEP